MLPNDVESVDSVTQKAVSGTKWNTAAVAVRVLVQFVSLAVLARLLSPDAFGLMNMCTVVLGIAQNFADFGIANALIYHNDSTKKQLSTLYWIDIAMGILICSITLILTPLIVEYYQEPRLTTLIHWTALTFLITPIGQQFDSLLRRDLRFRERALVQIISHIAYLLTTLTLALLGFGVLSLVWGVLVRVVSTSLALTFIGWRSKWLPTFVFEIKVIGGFLQFGLFQMGERTLNYFSDNIDYLLIGRFLGSGLLGYYVLAYNLMRLPLNALNPLVVQIAFPSFRKLREDDLIRKGYSKILRYLSSMVFPVMVGLCITAPNLIPLVFGEQWVQAVPIVQIFAILGIWRSLNNPLGALLLSKGRPDLGFYINIVKTVFFLIANLIGVNWGIMGVAVSVVIATALLVPATFYLQHYLIRFEIIDWWNSINNAFFASVCLLVAFVGGSTIFRYDSMPSYYSAMLMMGASILWSAFIYTIALWLLDRSIFREVWINLRVR